MKEETRKHKTRKPSWDGSCGAAAVGRRQPWGGGRGAAAAAMGPEMGQGCLMVSQSLHSSRMSHSQPELENRNLKGVEKCSILGQPVGHNPLGFAYQVFILQSITLAKLQL